SLFDRTQPWSDNAKASNIPATPFRRPAIRSNCNTGNRAYNRNFTRWQAVKWCFSPDALETSPADARNDQVRAFGLRLAVRPHWGSAGFPRQRLGRRGNCAQAVLDRGRDGVRPL